MLTLALAVAAILLFLRADARERQEEVLLRLRAFGGDETSALAAVESRAREVNNPLLRAACHLLWRSGAEAEPATVARILWVLVLLVPVTLLLFGLYAGLSILSLGSALAWGWLARRAAHRRARMLEQLPAYLENAMRVLAAGNTLEESLAAAARECQEPLRPLMQSAGRRMRLGAPVDQVLMQAGDIHRLRDLKVMALAAAINRKFGGSLRNILKSLIQTIRAREVAARELRALTAETRFSALVLSVMPVALSLYMYSQNPAYYTEMMADAAGRTMLTISVLMQVCGIVVIFRMMRSTEDGSA